MDWEPGVGRGRSGQRVQAWPCVFIRILRVNRKLNFQGVFNEFAVQTSCPPPVPFLPPGKGPGVVAAPGLWQCRGAL